MRKKFVPPVVNKAALPTPVIPRTTVVKEKVKDSSQSDTTSIKSVTPTSNSSSTTTLKRKFTPPAVINKANLQQAKVSKPASTSNSSKSSTTNDEEDEGDVWSVMFCKTSNKKHKTYDD